MIRLIGLLQSTLALSILPCTRLPDSGHLPPADLERVCRYHSAWLEERFHTPSLTDSNRRRTDGQSAYLRFVETCSSPSSCTNNTQSDDDHRHDRNRSRRAVEEEQNMKQKKAIRKEIRLMSQEERRRLLEAFQALRDSKVDGMSKWDLYTELHFPQSAVGAHWGAAFLPWHREFLRQFEVALRHERSDVALPYWDSTLDSGLPEPADSVLWTRHLLGNGNGFVTEGPFAHWDTNVFMPLSPVPIKKLFRSTGARRGDRLMSEGDVAWITSRSNFSQLAFCHDKTFESMHGLSHRVIEGFMYVLRVSPNDPVFYLHHSFIDHLWERFRQSRQSRAQRESDYASEVCSEEHALDGHMKPWSIRNRDGLSNKYTDLWYEYEAVQHCNSTSTTCQSEFLFCDRENWRCRSKIVKGGNCTGFENSDICYGSSNSQCVNGICVSIDDQKVDQGGDEQEPEPSDGVWTKALLIEEGDRPMMPENRSKSAIITVDSVNGQRRHFKLSPQIQYPEFPGLVYLSLPRPRSEQVLTVNVSARDRFDRYCQPYCLNSSTELYQVCNGSLNVSLNALTSSNLSFSHNVQWRRYLDVDLSMHPSRWPVQMPFFAFSCQHKMLNSSVLIDLGKSIRPSWSKDDYVWFRVFIVSPPSTNSSILNMDTAQIEVRDLEDPAEFWSSPIRRAQSPFDGNLLLVRARNPAVHRKGVTVSVSLRQDGRRICTTNCLQTQNNEMAKCDGSVFLHSNPKISDESVFTADHSILNLLGWRMIGHPQLWTHRPCFLHFNCS